MTTKRIIRISFFTLLAIIGGFIKIPVGTVAFTLQTVFVVLAGFVLGARDGMFALLAYMIIGLIGIPVFTQGGGFSYIFMPSFGYIIGFVIGAFTAGVVMSRFSTVNTLKIWVAGIIALLPVYIIGMAYQVMILVFVNGLTVSAALITLISILIYWAIDIVMIFIISIVYPRLMSMMKITANNVTSSPDDDNNLMSDKISGKVDNTDEKSENNESKN